MSKNIKRAASPLIKFKSGQNIQEISIKYDEDKNLFSKRAQSQ